MRCAKRRLRFRESARRERFPGLPLQECSSTGRAPVSKTAGCGFESLHSCQQRNTGVERCSLRRRVTMSSETTLFSMRFSRAARSSGFRARSTWTNRFAMPVVERSRAAEPVARGQVRERMAKTNPFEFMQQVRAEGSKVTWPTPQGDHGHDGDGPRDGVCSHRSFFWSSTWSCAGAWVWSLVIGG